MKRDAWFSYAPREGPGQAHSCPRAFLSSPEGPAPSSRLTLGHCGHWLTHAARFTHARQAARPGRNSSRRLLPASPLDALLPVSQGPGSLCFCRPFLQAPLGACAHAEHLSQPHLAPPALLLAAPSPPPPSHTPQLAADSRLSALPGFISPLKDPQGSEC